ncbi:MAG: PglZ domain-containing protein [Verrucomicrobia bacterium]|nr:PglZ domain-containing protein [Verrucomicrobiota bacterium]
MNPFPAYLHSQLEDKLKNHRVVVWYDVAREFEPFVASLGQSGDGGLPTVTIGTTNARLAVFQGSYFALRLQVEPLVSVNRPQPLLIYLPGERRDPKGSVLMELEKAGTTYEPQMKRLARNVMRKFFSDGVIDEMLAPDSLTYADILTLLEQNNGGERTSLLPSILGTRDNVAMVAAWVADAGCDEELVKKDVATELLKLIESRAGFVAEPGCELSEVRTKFRRFLLANEFREDLSCDAPTSLAMVPTPGSKEAREFCRKVLDHLRTRYATEFQIMADAVESDFGLATAGIDAKDLGSIDTFRFEERAMLQHCGEVLVAGDYGMAAMLAATHSQSFWARQDLSRRQAQWEVCALMAEIGTEIGKVEADMKKLGANVTSGAIVARYVAEDGWHRMDLAHRRLEARVARMDEEPETEAALTVIRSKVEQVLRTMAGIFGKALEASHWSVDAVLHQTRIWPQKVARLSGRVACFHVDAFRFEMGQDFSGQLAEALDMEVVPAIAVLPSITPLCMAALLPGAAEAYAVVDAGDKVGARIGTSVLTGVNERMKFLKAAVPDATDITLDRLLQDTPSKVQQKIGEARLLVVRSQEIDSLGEKSELLARHVMDTVVGNLARAVRRLAGFGFERFVVTADHGHQFGSRKDDDMKQDAPTGSEVELHRRCWIGRGPAAPVGTVTIKAPELGYDSNLDFVFPTGLGVFKAGGGLAYHHGGFSLQELVVPVVSFRMPTAAVVSAGPTVTLGDYPESITNRTFGVRLEVEADLVSSGPLRVQIILLSKGEEAGHAGMALGMEFDAKTRIATLPAGRSGNVAMVLTRDDVEAVRIVVQDSTTGSVLAESKPIPLNLKS